MEKAIERHKNQTFGQVPNTLNNLQLCLKTEKWKKLLQIDAESFVVEFVIHNTNTKAIIFIDKMLTKKIMDTNDKKVIFIDGTFATVPQIKNKHCQLWTILMRYNNRVSKTNNSFIR